MTAGITYGEMKQGPGRIFWGPAGSETELGMTEDGLRIHLSVPSEFGKCDEYGEEPVVEVGAGTILTVSLTLMQFANAQLLIALPGSAAGTGTSSASWNAGPKAGVDLSGTTYAKRLRWHPASNTDTSDETDNTIIHKCNLKLSPGSEIALRLREARKLHLIGQAFRDTSITTESNQFIKYGKDTS